MSKVFVISSDKTPLMPCHPARARELLKQKKAAVYRRYPFTLILLARESGEVQPVELRLDPGSKTTGIAIVGEFELGNEVLWAANLAHRGHAIKESLDKRRAIRRSRRNRKTRYRPVRWANRANAKVEGRLMPSLLSRVYNIQTWTTRLNKYAPVGSIAVETVRFDMQIMANPEISGVEYQQGELMGYEVREYLLEKFNRTCVYCGAKDVPLQIEHIIPKSKGGTDRPSNLTIACQPCNQKKGNLSLDEFLAKKPDILQKVKVQLKATFKDAAAVNATRYRVGNMLKGFNLPVTFWSGGRTKFNRTQQGYAKDHWIDAACVGIGGQATLIDPKLRPLLIKATGRGNRQMCRVDKYGFPRTSAKIRQKRVFGFATGDIVKAIIPKGKFTGTITGRISIRATGSFNIGQGGKVNHKYCQAIHRADGYGYNV
jgi:hypothetical protein